MLIYEVSEHVNYATKLEGRKFPYNRKYGTPETDIEQWILLPPSILSSWMET